jgi:hypothetical protein
MVEAYKKYILVAVILKEYPSVPAIAASFVQRNMQTTCEVYLTFASKQFESPPLAMRAYLEEHKTVFQEVQRTILYYIIYARFP